MAKAKTYWVGLCDGKPCPVVAGSLYSIERGVQFLPLFIRIEDAKSHFTKICPVEIREIKRKKVMVKESIKKQVIYSNNYITLFDDGKIGLSDGVGYIDTLAVDEVNDFYDVLKRLKGD